MAPPFNRHPYRRPATARWHRLGESSPGPRIVSRRDAVAAAVAASRPGAGAEGDGPSRRLEHREGVRRRLLVLVDLRWLDGVETGGLVRDLGPGGMFVLTATGTGVGRCVDVAVPAPDDPPLWIPGLVIHRQASGFGLMFRHLDRRALAFVQRCLG